MRLENVVSFIIDILSNAVQVHDVKKSAGIVWETKFIFEDRLFSIFGYFVLNTCICIAEFYFIFIWENYKKGKSTMETSVGEPGAKTFHRQPEPEPVKKL